ncbi:class I SAM-dependent methyltransferase [Candidatus Pelagibacter sp. HIMB123]|uniref:class I SAM-dependent methyltransferase n=1 Tax=Candidatus Pelagibacter sp. HIMB123 TaxID=3415413 RepID=UPI003F876F06
MIKRSSKQHIDNLLNQNPDWKVLDIGCGYTAHKNATVICDIQDLSNFYNDKNFVKLDGNILPFKDNEFDFVIASHVIEHVKDVNTFIKELSRVSSKGYIELPTILEDNLVFENKKDHIWHMEFDDIENKLNISEKIQYLEPVITVSTSKKFSKIFRQSLVLELYWEENIEFNLIQKKKSDFQKISRLTLFRKFLSKHLRNILRKN